MGGQLIIGTLLIAGNAIFHVACLVWLAGLLQRLSGGRDIEDSRSSQILILGVAVSGLIIIHTASAWAWAVVYMQVGEFTELPDALYFSVVTSTTLGYGDVTLSERWQLLASFEAMGGLILFSVSTAFLIGITKSWFAHLIGRGDGAS